MSGGLHRLEPKLVWQNVIAHTHQTVLIFQVLISPIFFDFCLLQHYFTFYMIIYLIFIYVILITWGLHSSLLCNVNQKYVRLLSDTWTSALYCSTLIIQFIYECSAPTAYSHLLWLIAVLPKSPAWNHSMQCSLYSVRGVCYPVKLTAASTITHFCVVLTNNEIIHNQSKMVSFVSSNKQSYNIIMTQYNWLAVN